jgi:adenylate kinase
MGTHNIVLIGPPGSGKGTQAAVMTARFGVPAISTGDILRAAVKSGSPLGKQVQAVMAAGDLVSDRLMVDLVRDRLSQPDTQSGFILDGFPRTAAQADALDEMLAGRRLLVLVLEVPERELERRLDARRICSTCKTLYSTGTRYGSESELCSRCGSILIKRDDDNLATIRTRLRTYRETAAPIVEHYRQRSAIVRIDASKPPDVVSDAILSRVERACRA